MAIEKTIDINVNAGDAITDLNLLNSILEEQEQITIELQQEQQKLEQQLRDTPKTSLAAQKKLNDELKHVKNSIKDQTLSVKKLKVQQTQLSKGTSNLTEDLVSNGGAMGLLNELTGGLAQKFKDSYEAISLSSKGLGGFKRAMLATGIGALVVGVGLLVANFDKVKDFLMGVSADTRAAREEIEKEMKQLNGTIAKQSLELEVLARGYRNGTLQGKQLQRAVDDVNNKFEDANIQLDENNQLTDESLAYIDAQIDAIKKQAKNKAILTKVEALYGEELEATSRIGQKNAALMAEITKQQVIQAKLAAETNLFQKEKLLKEIRSSENRQKAITSDIVSLVNERAGIQREIDQQVSRIEKVEKPKGKRKRTTGTSGKSEEQIQAEKEAEQLRQLEQQKAQDRINALQQIENAENAYFDSKLTKEELEIQKVNDKYFALIEAAKLYNEDVTVLEQARDDELAVIQEETNKKDLKKTKELQEAKDKIAKAEAAAKIKTFQDTENALNQLGAIAGEQTVAGKGLAIASATINTYRGVSDALAAKTVTPFETALKFVNAASILSSGLKNVKKIVGVKVPKVKGVNTTTSGGGGGGDATISQPPSFNIVGATETSQLAEARGEQTQQPVQAYVVANDVTTAQSLENNIVEGATLG